MVSAPAKLNEHFARVRGIARLSEDFAIQLDSGIRAHDNALAQAGVNLRHSRARFCFREPRNHGVRRLARKGRLLDLSWENFKRDSRIAQDFRAARRGRRQYDLHIRNSPSRETGYSEASYPLGLGGAGFS